MLTNTYKMKVDTNSEEFKSELEKTVQFAAKVREKLYFVENPDKELNEGVYMGLSNNKIKYGKRYCPCFIVIGETKEEQKNADNRICPCKPALKEEIPNQGYCHCGIFCTKQWAEENANNK